MVIVSVAGWLIFTSNVNYGVALGEEGGIARSDEGAGVVGGEKAEEVDCKGFIGVEVAIVRADQGTFGRAIGLEALGCLFCCHLDVT